MSMFRKRIAAPFSVAVQAEASEPAALSGEIAAGGGLKDADEHLKLEFLTGAPAASSEAFLKLYAKYETPLLLYCKRMLRDEQAAEDAFQDIWARIYELRNRAKSDEGYVIEHFRGLLFQSARNMCLNMMRTEHPHSSDELEPLLVDESVGRENTQREIQKLMVVALGKLPFDQREIFVLHEYSGFSYGEIADMMQSNEANVKVRAHRARLRLRKFIQGWLGLAESDDPSHYI